MKDETIDKAIHECYVELYKNATPSADFNELLTNAELNEFNQKIINFWDYEIENNVMKNIINKIIKKYKIKSNKTKIMFYNTICFGVSPTIKKQ
jgi:hypothetical protein